MTGLTGGAGPAVRAIQALALVGVCAYAIQGAVADPAGGLGNFFEAWVYPALIGVAGLLCLARAGRTRVERAAWLVLGAGLVSWTAGEAWYSLFLADLESPPVPGVPDVLWLAFYPACYAALVMLVHARQDKLHFSLWLDGVIGAFAVAAIGAAGVFVAIDASGSSADTLMGVDLAYLLGDFALIGLVVAVFGLTGWRPGAAWGLLGAGLIASALVDGFFMWEDATGQSIGGTAPAALWPAAALLVASAAWQVPATRVLAGSMPARSSHLIEGTRVMTMPLVFASAALALLMLHVFAPLNALALGLAVATLGLTIVRLALTFRENLSLLSASRTEALTDALTGLGNRRLLMHDLAAAAAAATRERPVALMIFDLDGFKRYNDTYGHPAGDALLTKLGSNLAFAIGSRGTTYRLGGDEFCALVGTGVEGVEAIRAEALGALSERGKGFEVGASCGVALIPTCATEPSAALKLADHRLYDEKVTAARTSVARQTGDALLQALQEREPDLRGHVSQVADLALAVGQRLGLDSDELHQVARAAELHDVGKVAVPDAILHKPGPLDEVEWSFMKQHTIVGDRILSAAPALAPVAKLVRSSHERYDGRGYPDKLSGDDIPLGARIVAVCDAFHAMTSDRPYRRSIGVPAALEELRRCSGLQFDPDVIEAFCSLVDAEAAPDVGQVAFLRARPFPATA
jgi:diguanylate cyclase (GGDEF)-like protein